MSTRHRWIVVAIWLVLILGAVLGSRAIGGTFNNDLPLAGTDSQAAYALIVMLVLVPALLTIAGRAAWGRTKRRSSAEPGPAPEPALEPEPEPLVATLGRG